MPESFYYKYIPRESPSGGNNGLLSASEATSSSVIYANNLAAIAAKPIRSSRRQSLPKVLGKDSFHSKANSKQRTRLFFRFDSIPFSDLAAKYIARFENGVPVSCYRQ